MLATGATGATATASAVSTTDADLSQGELTCTKCLATFGSSEAKRTHMRQDWHVYNLKRHMAALPPTSLALFQKQVLTSDSGNDEQEKPLPFQRSHSCNRKAWQAYLKSRSHAQKSGETDSETFALSDEPLPESLSSNTHETDQPANKEEIFNPSQCLFCNVESASLDSNLTHMLHEHSFFIPNAEYLIDMESLLSYLFAVISIFHECLFCGSSKTTKFAVQDHMRDKGHCKVDFEEDDGHDLLQFYDFSGGDVDDDDEEEEEGTQPKTQEEATLVTINEDDELRLPSGKVLGHRSHARFVRHQDPTGHASSSSSRQRQRIPAEAEAQDLESELASTTEPTTESTTESTTTTTDRRLASLRAGTSTSIIGVPDLQLRALIAIEKKMEKMATRERNEYQHVVEKGGNRQKRYKVASLGKKQGGLERRLG